MGPLDPFGRTDRVVPEEAKPDRMKRDPVETNPLILTSGIGVAIGLTMGLATVFEFLGSAIVVLIFGLVGGALFYTIARLFRSGRLQDAISVLLGKP